MMKNIQNQTSLLLIAAFVAVAFVPHAEARTRLKNICRVKGQEQNTLQGLGLVVGLNGTGDGAKSLPMIRSLATAMELLGVPVNDLRELDDAKNVALVMVTATVPPQGARQGDQVDCQIASVGGAKDLTGGTLMLTALVGPQPGNDRVYALASGSLMIESPRSPLTGVIHGGCRLEQDFFNAFSDGDKITLVLNKNHADFQVAQDVAELINSQLSFQSGDRNREYLAKALDQVNIEVRIPDQYRDDSVLFVSQVIGLPLLEPQIEARVTVNRKRGSVVISGDLEIGAAVVSHRNIVVDTGAATLPEDRFVGVDPNQTSATKLAALVEALNAVKVPTEDIIDIIIGLDRNGKLHGKLIVE